jgi:TPR repeat protein
MISRTFRFLSLSLLFFCGAAWGDAQDDLKKGDKSFKSADYATALQSYQEAAKAGNPAAQNNLGYLYEKGSGVPQDTAQALAHYRAAAEAGNAAGQNNLGRLYSEGKGVGRDNREAFRWHAKAADQGDPEGEYWIGYSFALGHGVRKDLSKAAKWLQVSAQAGYAPAQSALAHLYEQGKGVEKDPNQAREWRHKAATQNDPEAVKALNGKFDYTVVAGDSLWSIAHRFLTKGHFWSSLFELNKDILSRPELIRPGQVLHIQVMESEASAQKS